MKYLHYDLHEKACMDESYEKEWNDQYEEYMKEFNALSYRLPKSFIKEFRKHHMHDNIIDEIQLNRVELKSRYRYDLTLYVQDYYDNDIIHEILLVDVDKWNSDLSFQQPAGSFDWLYCEILEKNNKKLSLEVLLFDDSSLYVEFSKLRYKKHRIAK